MNNSETLGVLAALREVTELLAGLDLANLPEVGAIRVGDDIRNGGLSGRAQLYARCATELEAIDAIRTWAVALGAVVLLGEEATHSTEPYREITAVLRLPSGGLFEVWTHLHELRPAPEWTAPADSGLIAA